MDRPALLVLVRHGESERNIAKKGSVYFADDESRASLRGIPDHMVPLTDKGVGQARATGEALKEIFGDFGYIYNSGYLRTLQTMEGILKAYPGEYSKKVRQNIFLRERDPGYAYDMTTAEAETAFPWMAEYWITFGSFFARPPGGESVAQVCERVYLFLNMLFRDRAGQKIMVVTHGITLRAFRFLLEREPYETIEAWCKKDPPKNCSVTTYRYNESQGRLILEAYNSVYW